MLGAKRPLGREGRLPIPLQGAGHKPILRIDRFVAAPCQCSLVAGPFQPLLPLLVQLLAFEFEILGDLETHLDRRRR